jgi:hypothetical protein
MGRTPPKPQMLTYYDFLLGALQEMLKATMGKQLVLRI